MKSDLLDKFEKNILIKCYEPIETSKGEQKKEEVNASEYVECSSLKFTNVNKIFELAIEYAMKQTLPNSCCLIH